MIFLRVSSILVFCSVVGMMDAQTIAQTQTRRSSEQQDTASTESRTIGRKPVLDVPYVPTPHEVVDAMLKMANVTENDFVYDLGCGDGRIVIAAAENYGARGIGIDIDPERIQEAKAKAKKAGVANRVKFIEQNLFEADLSKASVVTLYLLSDINLKLRPKLFSELKPGTRVVSHSFDMGDWEPERTEDVDGRTIYYWVIPDKKETHGK